MKRFLIALSLILVACCLAPPTVEAGGPRVTIVRRGLFGLRTEVLVAPPVHAPRQRSQSFRTFGGHHAPAQATVTFVPGFGWVQTSGGY